MVVPYLEHLDTELAFMAVKWSIGSATWGGQYDDFFMNPRYGRLVKGNQG